MPTSSSRCWLCSLCVAAVRGAWVGSSPSTSRPPAARSRVVAIDLPQFGQKNERLLIRTAWEKADAYRPGKKNWFTSRQKDLVGLHELLAPEVEKLPEAPLPTNATSLLGALLKVLTTGDLALTLCSPEPPVLTKLRDWLVDKLPMDQAVLGLPEEQGRVLATLVRALDARLILDLGTYTGYSAIAMALAAADDAKVICCEPQTQPARAAREWFRKAGVMTKMQMNECEASVLLEDLLAKGRANQVDMVFVDIGDRAAYRETHEALMRLVRVGGIVVYYDTLWQADEVLQHDPYPTRREFNAMLASDPRVIANLVPLSYGITICTKTVSLDGGKLRSALAARDERADDSELLELLQERRQEIQAALDAFPPPPSAAEAEGAAEPAKVGVGATP